MAFSVGGSQNLGGSGGGDQRRMLPPGFPSQKLAPSPYQGFQHPPLYDAGRGHNLPLVPSVSELGTFTIQEGGIMDDYLLCEGFDPETKKFYSGLPVAKPRLLQKTPFNGKTFKRADRIFTLFYPVGPGWRIRVDRAEQGGKQTSVEMIDEEYFAGDVLVAARINHKGADRSKEGAIPQTEDGLPVEWMDLNVGARTWAPAFWDSMMMLFTDESTPYLPRQDYVHINDNGTEEIRPTGNHGAHLNWEQDLQEWDNLILTKGLPQWGLAFCDIPVAESSQPYLDQVIDNAAPFGVPAGITSFVMPSRNVSGQDMIDVYKAALRNPEGFEGVAPPSVVVMIDVSGSMSRAILSAGLSEFMQWLNSGAESESAYPVTLIERAFSNERWLQFFGRIIRETKSRT